MQEQALRDLTRARKQLTREKASHVQRIDKCQRRLDAPRFCRSKIPQARAIGDQPVW
jgi:hypothetical protein